MPIKVNDKVEFYHHTNGVWMTGTIIKVSGHGAFYIVKADNGMEYIVDTEDIRLPTK